MDALIFFAVIIFFSILDSVAKRRRGKGRGPIQLPEEWESDEDAWRTEERLQGASSDQLPTYDSDPTYDDLHRQDGGRSDSADRSGSEGLIPSEVWREIEKLAERAQRRGRQPSPTSTTPRPEPEAPRPSTERRDRSPSSGRRSASTGRVAGRGQQHRVHRAHAEYGTDPSERSRSEQDGLDPLARVLGADPAAARRQLRGSGRHALRQAVILQEILGPPASLRRDDLTDPLSD